MHRPQIRPRALVGVGGSPLPWYLSPREPRLSFDSLPVWGNYATLTLDNKVMQFYLEVESDFDGTANFVQLINAHDRGNFVPLIRSTRGEFYLDNTSPYNASGTTVEKGKKAYPDLLDFPSFNGGNWDGLQADWKSDYIYINNNFKSYCYFVPPGNDSIWITLAIVSWEWNAAADRPKGGTWTVTSYCPPPVFQESDEFPYWENGLLNGYPWF